MLASATKYYKTNFECRNLLDNNLHSVVKILLHRSTAKKDVELYKRDKYGLTELDYIEKSIRFALRVINDDLKMSAPKITAKCKSLETLTLIFIDVYYNKNRSIRKDRLQTFQNIKVSQVQSRFTKYRLRYMYNIRWPVLYNTSYHFLRMFANYSLW